MSTAALNRLTWQEYLQRERAAETRSDFCDSRILATQGASRSHCLIVGSIAGKLCELLESTPCEVYPSDMRVRCPNGLGTYPDVSVACDPLCEDEQEDTLLNPVVIVEVLSPSTEAYDRGQKFVSYRGITSLRKYVLVSQDHRLIEHYVRQSEFDQWLLTSYSKPEDRLELPTLGVSLSVADVYARIDFTETAASPLAENG